MKDYYYILGVDLDANKSEIKQAYRKLSLKFHPDKNNGDKFFESRFKEVQEAYEILSNESSKKIYDTRLRTQRSHSDRDSYGADNSEKGEIIDFAISNTNISGDEEVTLFWSTKNIQKVKLSCFEEFLPPTGNKRLKIKAAESKMITIFLNAYDVNNQITSKSLIVKLNRKDSNDHEDFVQPEESVKFSTGLNFKPLLWFLSTPIILSAILVGISNDARIISVLNTYKVAIAIICVCIVLWFFRKKLSLKMLKETASWILFIPGGLIMSSILIRLFTYFMLNPLRYDPLGEILLPFIVGGLQLYLFISASSFIAPRNDTIVRTIILIFGVLLCIYHLCRYHSIFDFFDFMFMLVAACVGLYFGVVGMIQGKFDRTK